MNNVAISILIVCSFFCLVPDISSESSEWIQSRWLLHYIFQKNLLKEATTSAQTISPEEQVALCTETLNFRIFVVTVTADEKINKIIENINIYKDKFLHVDRNNPKFPFGVTNNNFIPCIMEENFELHLSFSKFTPNLRFVYVRMPYSAESTSSSEYEKMKLFALTQRSAIHSSPSSTEELEGHFLDSINNIITDANSYFKIHYDICHLTEYEYLRLCSSAFNSTSIAPEQNVFTEVRIALGCSRNSVRFVHPKKKKTLMTRQEDQPQVHMVTCEFSPDLKFYVTANINEYGSVFVLHEYTSDELKKEDDDKDTKIVHVTDYVRSVPVLLEYR